MASRPALRSGWIVSVLLFLMLTAGCATTQRSTTSVDILYAIRAARDRVYPALVRIDARQDVFVDGERERAGGTGSGTIFSPEGHVLTNFHVAGKAKEIKCTLFNKEQVSATLVGADPWTDLTVLQLDMDEVRERGIDLPWVEIGTARPLEVGEFVLAMGTPYGLSRTVTFGIVSNVERYLGDGAKLPGGIETGSFNNWIQTDAAINPGNSGGPLVNLEGNVVGVNSRASLGADGLGYAVPLDIVAEVVREILAEGEVARAWIGLQFQNTQDLEGFLATDRGVLVREVEADSPAAVAGVREGDILLAVGGTAVGARFQEELPAVRRMLSQLPIGSDVELELQRNGRSEIVQLQSRRLGESQGADFDVRRWGFTVRSITKRMARSTRLVGTDGVLVTGVKEHEQADEGGLRSGDVIIDIDGKEVADLASFEQVVESLADATEVLIKVRRFRSINFVLLDALANETERSDG